MVEIISCISTSHPQLNIRKMVLLGGKIKFEYHVNSGTASRLRKIYLCDQDKRGLSCIYYNMTFVAYAGFLYNSR
jgi:hypothetical protein